MYFTLTKLYCPDIRKIFLLVFLASASIRWSQGQILQSARYEIQLTDNEKYFEIIPSGNAGLYLNRRVLVNREDKFHLVRLDTAFREIWAGIIPVDRNYLLMGRASHEGWLYLLLRYKDYSKNDLVLYRISEQDGGYTQHTIKSFIPFAPTEFQITDQSALIGGYFNRVPVVLHFSFTNLRSKVLPGLFNEAGELTQIKTYDDGSFDVLISARNMMRQKTIWIKNYDAEGDLIRNFALDPAENRHLIFGRSVKTSNDMQIVAGVYGNRSADFSRGIFLARIDPSGYQQIRYYNYGDLQNFFKYMKARREKRVKDRIERRRIKGKKIRFNYRFLVHELVPHDDQFILLGEAFYPKYISVDRGYGGFFSPYSANPGMIVQNGRIFDGYYYTHAVVMGFNEEGKLLWDNSFEINDVKTFTLDQFVKLEVNDDKIALFYLYENDIRTKIIKNNQVLEGKTIDPISTGSNTEIVRKDNREISKLEYWYGDYLYAYGVQDILRRESSGISRRKVFYINKVTYGK